MMTYKGFVGVVEYDDEARIFSGEVINTRTVITFQGTTVDEVENEFHASVDDYLEWCKEDGIDFLETKTNEVLKLFCGLNGFSDLNCT